MHTIYNNIIRSILASSLLFATACGDTEEEPFEQSEVEALVTLTLDNGAIVEFYENEPGDLAVTVSADSEESVAFMDELSEQHVSAVDLYETLSGEAAPLALVEADQRANQARIEGRQIAIESGFDPDAVETGDESEDGIGQTQQALSGSSFKSKYCKTSSYWNIKYCMTNQTSPFSVGSWTTSMYCRANTVSGSLLMIFQTWYPFSWNNMLRTINSGQIWRYYSYGYFTDRRCHLYLMFPGTKYHASIYGKI